MAFIIVTYLLWQSSDSGSTSSILGIQKAGPYTDTVLTVFMERGPSENGQGDGHQIRFYNPKKFVCENDPHTFYPPYYAKI
jgi:hypothetical protein